jgi:alkylation response protein AidB-like acyl-CoA dehydrogenase
MEFTFSEEQLAVAQAAGSVFDGAVDPDRVAAVEESADRVDRPLWSLLAAADLLGLAVPTDIGGGGLGLTEICLVLQAQGRVVAPVPLWPTLVGSLVLGRAAPAPAATRWLPGVARGEVVLSVALRRVIESPSATPGVVARSAPGGDGFVLTGTEPAVPDAHVADRVLVPARTESGDPVVVLVDPAADGARLERATTTNREIHPHLHLDGVVVPADEVVGGAEALVLLRHAATTALCALQIGVCEAALGRTADYLNQRRQFERPLSAFQATMLRAADAAIDLEAMRVTLWQAAWRVDTGRPAEESVAVAAWQAAERGQRIVHATQHLHGGIGADVTYPIHRYFLWGKQIELQLGGASRQLSGLGALLAKRFRRETAA